MLVALSFLLQGLKPMPNLNISEATQTLPTILATVNKQCDAHLECDALFNKDVFAVSLQNFSLEEFKQQIAKIECADWVTTGETETLTLNQSLLDQDVQKSDQALANALRAKLEADLAARQQKSSRDAQFHPGHSSSEAQIEEEKTDALMSAVIQFKGSDWVHLGELRRTVYSSDPNSVQRAFPAEVANIINNDILPLEEKNASQNTGQFLKYDLAIANTYHPNAYHFNLTFYATNGSTLDTVSAAELLNFSDQVNGVIKQLGGPHVFRSTPDQHAVAEVGTMEGVAHRVALVHGQKTLPAPAAEVANLGRKLLTDPIKYDPLTWASELIMKSAESSGKTFIALLPDSVYKIVDLALKPRINSESVIQTAIARCDLRFDITDNCVTAAPIHRQAMRRDRTSRKFLSSLVNYEKSHSQPDLSTVADIAAHFHGLNRLLCLGFQYLLPFHQGWTSLFYGNQFQMLSLYGSLDDSNKTQIQSGQSISLDTVPPRAKQRVKIMDFSLKSIFWVHTTKPPVANNEVKAVMFGVDYPGFNLAQGLQAEPTEFCPDGLSGNTAISGKMSTKVAYILAKSDNLSEAQLIRKALFSVSRKHAIVLLSQITNHYQHYPIRSVKWLYPVNRTSLEIKIKLPNHEYIFGTVHQSYPIADAKPISVKEFEANHQAEFDSDRKQWYQMLLRIKEESTYQHGKPTTPP